MSELLVSYSIVCISSLMCVLIGNRLLHPKNKLFITLCYLFIVVVSLTLKMGIFKIKFKSSSLHKLIPTRDILEKVHCNVNFENVLEENYVS